MRRLFLRHHPALRLAALLVLGVALAGCGPGGAWALAWIALVGSLGLSLTGCSESHTQSSRDAAVAIDGSQPPVELDAGADAGTWEPCCVEGRTSTCFCPAGAVCNYEMALFCPDGTCGFPPSWPADPEVHCNARDGGVDAEVDAGGTWEPCCNSGRIETCFCPAGAACNYGPFEFCGGDTCVNPGDECPAPPAD